MPRYFFHLTDGFVEHDTAGTELEDLKAARLAAIVFTGECLCDNPHHLQGEDAFQVEVTSDGGRLLLTVVASVIEAVQDAKDLGQTAT